MFNDQQANLNVGQVQEQGRVTITQPRGGVPRTKHKEFGRIFKEDYVSGMRLYCPRHVYEHSEHGIKMVFLVPNEMNRLNLHVRQFHFLKS